MTSPRLAHVIVPVANVWTRPSSPREVDAAATSDRPDVAGWLALLDERPDDGRDGDGRLGLHGRLDTQLALGEPVLVDDEDPQLPGWVHVVAPWQPSGLDPRGYPGWVRAAHLSGADDAEAAAGTSAGTSDGTSADAVPGLPAVDPDVAALAAAAEHPLLGVSRRHLGLPYLWAGVTPYGLDCSGLVHHGYRALGLVVPRDADDQQDSAEPVALDEVRPGDLYFFTKPDATRAYHVGIVVRPGVMVHAPETGQGLVEEPLTPPRQATLSGAGRFVLPL